jgi:hypothetical protein
MKRSNKNYNYKPLKLDELEEAAFYESGLSAHGCLEHLDNYTRQAIIRYGRYLLKETRLEEHEKFLEETNKRLKVLIARVEIRTEMIDKLYTIVEQLQTKSDQNSLLALGSPLYVAMTEALTYYHEKIEKPKKAKKASTQTK